MERVIITGASRGIGRALAVRLASDRRTITIQGRDGAALDETRRLVEQNHGYAEIVACDLAKSEGINDLVTSLGDTPIHALVNNAGVSNVAPIEDLTVAQWHETLAVNVTAPFLLTQRLLPQMSAGASIVNILSVANKVSFPQWSAYTTSKSALEGFSRVLREELRPRGIRVIDIYPAATATELWDSVPGDWPRDGMLRPDEAAAAIAYALERPASVLLDSLSIGSLGGNL